MANALVPLSGRATVGIELTANDGTREQLLLPSQFAVDSAVLSDPVNRWREWTIQIRATSRAIYQQRIVPLLLSSSRQLSVRWGIDTGVEVVWGPSDDCRVLRVTEQMQNNASAGSGFPFEMVLAGGLYELGIEQRVVARSGLISDMMEQLAEFYGLEAVVEPTGGVPLALVQSYETDLGFTLRRLCNAAVNSAGVAGYYLYVQAGTLYFRTRDYLQQPYTLPYSPAASNLIALDDVQQHAQDGGTGTQLVTYDPLAGRTLVTDSDPQHYTRFASRLAQADGQTMMAAHAGPNQFAFEIGRAQANYALQRDQFERVSFSGANMLDLVAGRIIRVQLPNAQDAANGYYHVELVNLTIRGGTAIASATAARGEVGGGGRTTGGNVQSADTASPPVPPPFDAPGHDPNFSPVSTPVLGQGGPSVAVRPSG